MLDLSLTENQVLLVSNFQDLITTPFHGDTNAIGWTRNLKGDFSEIVNKLDISENIAEIDHKELHELQLSEQGALAREILLNDFKLLKEHGGSPTLNIIKHYERDDSYPFFPTDVYSFHVDRSPIPTDTYLCTYHGDSSDILPNSQAIQKILIPQIREELKKLHGTDNDFESFLSDFFFDLHYQAKPNAQPINLGNGHIWRLAIDHPESKVLPCIHRAPKEISGQSRLLMIC